MPFSAHHTWIGVAVANMTCGHGPGPLVSRCHASLGSSRGGIGPEYAALVVGLVGDWSRFRGRTRRQIKSG